MTSMTIKIFTVLGVMSEFPLTRASGFKDGQSEFVLLNHSYMQSHPEPAIGRYRTQL
jgi:hypothetical protein